MWSVEQDLLNNYVAKGISIPADKAVLPEAVKDLLREYFYVLD